MLDNQNLKLTTEKQFIYISDMRKMGVLVLSALIISLVAPVYAVTAAVSQNDSAVIFTLDVCSSSGSSLAANQDIPALYECPCKIVPMEFTGFQHISRPVFSLLLIPSQEERPPKS